MWCLCLGRFKVRVRASKKFGEEFVRELEGAFEDIVEGRVMGYEEFREKYGVKVKKKVKA